MKINAVMNLMKKSATIYCGMYGDAQWIMSDCAAYNISVLPQLNEEQLLAMMNIPEKKKGDYTVYPLSESAEHLLDKSGHTLKVIDRGMINICINGTEYEPLIIENHVYFIDVRYYKPFDGIEWDISAWIDKKSKAVCIAVTAGFLVLGYIMPTNIKTDYISMDLALITETIKRQKEFETEEYDDEE